MKILMVYPKYPDTYWSFNHVLKFVGKGAIFPPLGLMTVSSMLPRNWEKKLIDMNVDEVMDIDILWADYVFVSAMIVQRASVKEIIERCNKLGRKVVAGGPAFTTANELYKGVDHFVLNEGEVTVPMFLKDLKKGKPKKFYRSTERPPITKTPIPDWSLININRYSSMAVQYSRGCPFNCEFCDIIVMNGRKPRTKTPKQMMAEIRSLHKTGYRGPVFIVDDNFIGNKKHVKQFLPLLIRFQKKNKFPFSFFTEASTNLADDKELMTMMADCNFNKVFLGIETPNMDSLQECGKYQNIKRDLGETVRTINGYGMQVMGGFIVGFDNDTEETFKNQIDFIQENGIVWAMVGILMALPETALYKRLQKEGRLIKALPSGENTDGTMNFEPKMDKEILVDGYKHILSTIYSQKYYYRRIKTFIKFYKPRRHSKLKAQDMRAFFRSIWEIGILSKARFRYWDLLISTAIRNYKAFPVAVEYAILGEHFRKITKKVVG